jgi:hypothetical protein
LTLAERWNGSSWAIQPTPNLGATPAVSELFGVSCTAATACTAVGDYGNSSGNFSALAERWNGSSWAIQRTPNPNGATANTFLSGVSCTAATACTAVGEGYSPVTEYFEMLAERWNGSSWKIQPTPNPAGAFGSSLYGVSCAAATACTAVGYYGTSSSTVTLAERWNGSSWKSQPTPNPSGAFGSLLSGVWCTAATSCTAVGYDDSSSSALTLAERWNGSSWTIQPTPDPSGATFSDLIDVSCTAATACTGVGDGYHSSSTQVTLAERLTV